MEKLLMEATLEILEAGLVVGLQDLGAAGLTSSGAEMAGRAGNGLRLDLDKVPLREEGLAPWEIMLSESQERMLLVVEPSKAEAIGEIFEKWDLLASAVGEVTGDGHFAITKGQETLASVPAAFLTDLAPVYQPQAKEPPGRARLLEADLRPVRDHQCPQELLYRLLDSPNIASKRWIYEQYDHMVGLNTVIRPGGDAALLRLPGTRKGLALSCDCNSRYVYLDPYLGGAIAVAEAALNVAVTGARPLAITNCLNFGNPENPEIYWQFLKATDGIALAARKLGTPVTGGNVSFYNEYDGKAIYPTPVIGMVGLIDDIGRRLPAHFRKAGDLVALIGPSLEELGASEAHYLLTGRDEGPVPCLDLDLAARLCRFMAAAASQSLLSSAHDLSDGGLAVALAESSIPSGLGLDLSWEGDISAPALFFGESQSRVLASLPPESLPRLEDLLRSHRLPYALLGRVSSDIRFMVSYNSREIFYSDLEDLGRHWGESLEKAAKI
jgi:phosphoribosylformylglycinamidine synthase